ncbi:hypothetical protein ACFZC5_25510 [Nocardia gamkensis]|uniref:hypothetical protein n=1 Tax=Nocardia gamkensis TaxID=352869 RepID=UPI0036E631B8
MEPIGGLLRQCRCKKREQANVKWEVSVTEFDVHHAADDLARMAADFERRAGRFQELEGRMQALTVTESGKDGRVRITLDSSGAPTAIDLLPSSRSGPGGAVRRDHVVPAASAIGVADTGHRTRAEYRW